MWTEGSYSLQHSCPIKKQMTFRPNSEAAAEILSPRNSYLLKYISQIDFSELFLLVRVILIESTYSSPHKVTTEKQWTRHRG